MKENAMCASRIAAVALCLGSFGCRQVVAINPNAAPIADARAVDPATGEATETMIAIPFPGTPVTVTLDARESTDDDGLIAQYLWLSGTGDADAGVTRAVPAGEAANWPADQSRVDVTLGEGEWMFNLWVRDEEGLYSLPDTVLVNVGSDPISECVDMVVDQVAEPCRMCMCGIESCRPMIVESACGTECWSLIQCIGANCPNFQMMAMMMDFSCLTTNCMAEYVANMGGPTPMGATPAGACARMCPAECAAMPSM
jgi:hypothetical protein